MFRVLAALALSGLLLLTLPVMAQWGDPIAGAYSSSIGGHGHVQNYAGGYLFTDEVGATQLFRVTGRRQLRSGNIIVIMGRDNFGRTVLRFDAPGSRCIYWVRLC